MKIKRNELRFLNNAFFHEAIKHLGEFEIDYKSDKQRITSLEFLSNNEKRAALDQITTKSIDVCKCGNEYYVRWVGSVDVINFDISEKDFNELLIPYETILTKDFTWLIEGLKENEEIKMPGYDRDSFKRDYKIYPEEFAYMAETEGFCNFEIDTIYDSKGLTFIEMWPF
jgi:hypothetical protein